VMDRRTALARLGEVATRWDEGSDPRVAHG
jgi:hypothetical protein